MTTVHFEVLEGGLQTTLQDAGRFGQFALGVPRSGVLDPLSWRLGNLIVGNPADMAALELRSPGPALRLHAPGARIALTGSSAGVLIDRANGAQEWPSWRAIDLYEGDAVRVLPFSGTAVAYLAVAGGFAAAKVFGSRSTLLRGGFGGFDGRALKPGDRLPLEISSIPGTPCRTLLSPPAFEASPVLRALDGPQADHFVPAARAAFFEQPFTVSRDLDRMGVRLDGPELARTGGDEFASDATVPGAVQVPGSAILLLNDCQTTGGYPKIAVVISADMPAAGRLLPGTEIHFRRCSVTDAVAARAEARQAFVRLAELIVPVRA